MTGDAVNVAARLEQAAGAGEVLLGETTFRLVRDAVAVEELAPLEAKGKSEPARRVPAPAGGRADAGRRATPLVGRTAELLLLEHEVESALADGRLPAPDDRRRAGRRQVAAGGRAARAGRPAARAWPAAPASRTGKGSPSGRWRRSCAQLAGIRDEDSVEEARARACRQRIAQLRRPRRGLDDRRPDRRGGRGVPRRRGGRAAARRARRRHPLGRAGAARPAGRLPGRIGRRAVIVLCLARPELLEARPDWPVTVRLEPLDAAEVDALLDQLDAPASVRVRIAQTAGGNPLYAEELVAWVQEGGDLDDMPTTLNALLGARLDRLEEPGARRARARRGRGRAVSPGGDRRALRGARATVGARRARPARAQGPDPPRGREPRRGRDRLPVQAHPRPRGRLPRRRRSGSRADLHERFADWLERVAGERVAEYHEILGYHFEQAYRYREELGAVDADAQLARRPRRAPPRRRGPARERPRRRRRRLEPAQTRAALLPLDSVERLELLRHLAYAVDQTGRMLEARAIAEELYERATRARRARGSRPTGGRTRRRTRSSTARPTATRPQAGYRS